MADAAYGLWPLFILNTAVFAMCAVSVLAVVYLRLARVEERDIAARFGTAWQAYAGITPVFVPWRRRTSHPAPGVASRNGAVDSAAGRR